MGNVVDFEKELARRRQQKLAESEPVQTRELAAADMAGFVDVYREVLRPEEIQAAELVIRLMRSDDDGS